MIEEKFTVVRLTRAGCSRVLQGREGMTFIVDKFTVGLSGYVAHVRDYRFPSDVREYQVWSVGPSGYHII